MRIFDARIYVGTYAKYNNGNLEGSWLDLNDFFDREEFYEACRHLHRDEDDPEFIFQDWEQIPDHLVSESNIDDAVWDILDLSLDDETEEGFIAYLESGYGSWDDIYESYTLFQEDYMGEYKDEETFAREYAEELGYFDAMQNAGISPYYFDLEAFSSDIFITDFFFNDGRVYKR